MSWRAAIAWSVVVSCLGACQTEDEAPAEASWAECQASDQALVRRAFVAVVGRLPRGHDEARLYTDVLRGLRAAGFSEYDSRQRLVRLLSRDEQYVSRWSDFFLDSLRVQRRVTSSYFGALNESCFGPVGVPEGPDLAAWVRDHSPVEEESPYANFTMARLFTSALLLDDLSPLYRAGLFQLMTSPLPGNNVDALKLEWTRRRVLGETFHEVYLNRNLTCLTCHNSEASVTYSDDPKTNRFWTLPGFFERALYGTSDANADALDFHSVFRFSDVATGSTTPWGWSINFCHPFQTPESDDPLGYEVSFGSIKSTPERPTLGKRASVWNLEYSLRRGVDSLAESGGLAIDPNDPNALDPDQALAYLVAASAAEDVWEETVGTALTIANHFPRTQIQRDTLEKLTDAFARSHFSLQTLLTEIVANPAFNLATPEAGCGQAAYPVPRLFNPWTDAEDDPALRGNSVGDAVFARSPRPMVRALHAAMGWPAPTDFPKAGDGDFQASVGFFLGTAEPGFRGLSFEARLAWEERYARCASSAPDFISDLVARATATNATVEDAVVSLKDRLINEPTIDPAERAPLEALLSTSLASPLTADHEGGLRLACGAYLSSPQFSLAGLPPRDTSVAPKLAPEAERYDPLCKTLSLRVSGIDSTWSIECGSGALKVHKK